MVWKFCEIWIFYGNCFSDKSNSVRFCLTVWDMACMKMGHSLGNQWDPDKMGHSLGKQWDPDKMGHSLGKQWDPDKMPPNGVQDLGCLY